MTSIDEFYFRYYANRLLREGYITEKEFQGLLTENRLHTGTKPSRIPTPQNGIYLQSP